MAVPKTGIPLSWFCHSKIVATAFVLIVFPVLCLAPAIVRRINDGTRISKGFATQLLELRDWFAFWRLNCVHASCYALCAGAEGFDMEDKFTFLESCEARGTRWVSIRIAGCGSREKLSLISPAFVLWCFERICSCVPPCRLSARTWPSRLVAAVCWRGTCRVISFVRDLTDSATLRLLRIVFHISNRRRALQIEQTLGEGSHAELN